MGIPKVKPYTDCHMSSGPPKQRPTVFFFLVDACQFGTNLYRGSSTCPSWWRSHVSLFVIIDPHGLMVIAVDFWIHWLERTRVQTPVRELNWSELEVVVAGEGGHCVGRGPPSCLVWTTDAPARLHLEAWTTENWPKQHEATGVITEEDAVQI